MNDPTDPTKDPWPMTIKNPVLRWAAYIVYTPIALFFTIALFSTLAGVLSFVGLVPIAAIIWVFLRIFGA